MINRTTAGPLEIFTGFSEVFRVFRLVCDRKTSQIDIFGMFVADVDVVYFNLSI